MSAPEPPSPPSGPPNGTNFSRRKLTAPRPPWPAWTAMTASSTNRMRCRRHKKSPGRTGALYAMEMARTLLGLDAHEGVLLDALLPILHTARNLGKQGVVGARTPVFPGPINGAGRTHEDFAGKHVLAADLLEAEPFRLGFAAV